MGFLETVGRLMAKLVGGKLNAATAEWEANMTLAQIEDLERQGCDMTEYRAKFEAREAAEKKRIQESVDSQDLSILDQYKAVPRDENGQFMIDVCAIARPSSKRKKLIADAKIVYCAIAQAHNALWKPGNNDESTGIVVVFSPEGCTFNSERLKEVAKNVMQMKESSSVPADCAKFIKTLRDDQSIFCFKLGSSLAGDDNIWCATVVVEKQSALPNSCLPATRIVPYLLLENPVENYTAQFEMIPSKYYTKA